MTRPDPCPACPTRRYDPAARCAACPVPCPEVVAGDHRVMITDGRFVIEVPYADLPEDCTAAYLIALWAGYRAAAVPLDEIVLPLGELLAAQTVVYVTAAENPPAPAGADDTTRPLTEGSS